MTGKPPRRALWLHGVNKRGPLGAVPGTQERSIHVNDDDPSWSASHQQSIYNTVLTRLPEHDVTRVSLSQDSHVCQRQSLLYAQCLTHSRYANTC